MMELSITHLSVQQQKLLAKNGSHHRLETDKYNKVTSMALSEPTQMIKKLIFQ